MQGILTAVVGTAVMIIFMIFILSKGVVEVSEIDKKVTVYIKGVAFSLLSMGVLFAGVFIPERIRFNMIYHIDDKSPIFYLVTELDTGEDFCGEIIDGKRIWVPYDEYKVQVDTEIRDVSPIVFETSVEDTEYTGSVITLPMATVEIDVLDNMNLFLMVVGFIGMIAGGAYIFITLDRIKFGVLETADINEGGLR